MTKVEIENKYWSDFVGWAKKNPVKTIIDCQYIAFEKEIDRELTTEEFWKWYQKEHPQETQEELFQYMKAKAQLKAMASCKCDCDCFQP